MLDLKEMPIWRQDACFEVGYYKEVSFESIDALIRVLREACDYQQFDQLQISIQSPGGEFSALKHFLWHLQGLRLKGTQVKTVGMTQVASAAALMLSMGDLGQRYAYPHTEIVYHFARLPGVQGLTAQRADYLKKNLLDADQQIMDALVAHITPQIVGQMFPKKEVRFGRIRFASKLISNEEDVNTKVRADLERLFHLDRPISAEQAVDFYLLDHVLNQQEQEISL